MLDSRMPWDCASVTALFESLYPHISLGSVCGSVTASGNVFREKFHLNGRRIQLTLVDNRWNSFELLGFAP
jgi:hypothetical protein